MLALLLRGWHPSILSSQFLAPCLGPTLGGTGASMLVAQGCRDAKRESPIKNSGWWTMSPGGHPSKMCLSPHT